jgi:hypothetical protein
MSWNNIIPAWLLDDSRIRKGSRVCYVGAYHPVVDSAESLSRRLSLKRFSSSTWKSTPRDGMA